MRLALSILFLFLSSQSLADVQKLTLANGLKIIVKEDHRAPVAVTMVWYNTGSADEPGGMTGVSHALEHMMFKGTSKYARGMFSKKIALLGGQENAFTNYDYTAYFEKIAASQVATTLELEADRMQNLLLDNDEFTREIKVIQEERRMRTDDNPQALTLERYMAAANLTDPYHHPVIGWMSDLKQMTIHDLRSWYQNFYTPNNATLVVVGDVKAKKVFELAHLYFDALPKRPNFIRKTQTEPPITGSKQVNIHAKAQLPMLMFGYTVPSIKTATNTWEPYALEVVAGILDGGDNARFAKQLIRGNHIAANTDVSYDLYSRYQTQFVLFAIPSQGHTLKQCKTAMLAEINRLKQEQVKEAELQRIKTQLIAQKTFEKDSILSQATELGLLETVGLGSDTAESYSNHINAITPQQIQDIANRYFNTNAITEARLFPLSQAGKKP